MTHHPHDDVDVMRALRRRLSRALTFTRLPRVGPRHAPPPIEAETAGSFAALTNDALAATGAWVYETDAQRILRRLSPITTPNHAALIGRDMRSLFDPLSGLSEHARMARAVQARQPFSDLLMPVALESGPKLLRVSGAPFRDGHGRFLGYRGLAIDATESGTRPDATVELIAPDARHALINTLGVIVGFGHLLQDELPDGGAQHFVARMLIAAATARNIVVASSPAQTAPTDDTGDALPVPLVAPRAAPLHRRVLLVHEIPEYADLLSTAFDRLGFESAVCRHGAEVLEILEEDASLWDALIADAANGAGLLHRAKALRPDLLCVVCDEPERAALAEAEADLCWPKPIEALALAGMIKVQLCG